MRVELWQANVCCFVFAEFCRVYRGATLLRLSGCRRPACDNAREVFPHTSNSHLAGSAILECRYFRIANLAPQKRHLTMLRGKAPRGDLARQPAGRRKEGLQFSPCSTGPATLHEALCANKLAPLATPSLASRLALFPCQVDEKWVIGNAWIAAYPVPLVVAARHQG